MSKWEWINGENNFIYVLGGPGSGKSKLTVEWVRGLVGKVSLLIIDPQKSTSMEILKYCIDASVPIIADDLDKIDRVVPFEFVGVSEKQDRFERSRENKRFEEAFSKVMERTTGMPMRETPLKQETIRMCVALYQQLPMETRKTFGALALTETAARGSMIKAELMRQLPDSPARRRAREIEGGHFATYAREIGPAYRLLETTILNPTVSARVGNSNFCLMDFMKDKGVFVIHGGTPEEIRMIGGWWNQKFLNVATRCNYPTMVVLEEANNFGLLVESDARATLTHRKHNFAFLCNNQIHDEKDPIQQMMAQGSGTKVVMNCTSRREAEWGALQVSSGVKIGQKIDYHKSMQVADGWEEYETRSVDHEGRKRTNQAFRQRLRIKEDPVFATRNDQVFDLVQEIQYELKPGWAFINNRGNVSKRYTPLPQPISPWGEEAEKALLNEWLEKHYQNSPYYVSPNLVLPERLPMGCADVNLSDGAGQTHARRHRRTASDFLYQDKQRKGS